MVVRVIAPARCAGPEALSPYFTVLIRNARRICIRTCVCHDWFESGSNGTLVLHLPAGEQFTGTVAGMDTNVGASII